MIDLGPAADGMRRLLAGLDDARLDAPTPSRDTTVGDLVDHVGSLTLAFTAAARKETGDAAGQPPVPAAANLEPGWRDRIGRDLDGLVAAWSDPSAWDGFTRIGGVDLPGEVCGLVALDELLVHGWDLAVASGQPFDASDAEVLAATAFVANFDAPRDGTLFGPVVAVPDGAPALDRLLSLTGRDPAWRP